jgi:hypothetical protein
MHVNVSRHFSQQVFGQKEAVKKEWASLEEKVLARTIGLTQEILIYEAINEGVIKLGRGCNCKA